MIKSIKHLCWVLKTTPSGLDTLMQYIDSYYELRKSVKTKYGLPQIKNGELAYRELNISLQGLKRIQVRINDLLQKLEQPIYCFGSVRGRNHIMNAQQHINGKYFLYIDLKNFFPTITNRQVYNALIHYDFSPHVARILTRLTTYNGRLPIGPPSSPTIANLTFSITANELYGLAKNNNITFTTFLDDITFSSSKDFKQLVPTFLKEITDAGYNPHHQKISYRKSKHEVTGVCITQNGLQLPTPILANATINPNVARYITQFYTYTNRIGVHQGSHRNRTERIFD